MRTITAKFTSKCNKCQGTIKKGTEIIYDPSEKKAYHKECKPAEQESNPDAWISQALEDAYCKFY